MRVNGLTEIALTKLDILNGFTELPVCIEYNINGKIVKEMPASLSQFRDAQPVYQVLPGWGNLPNNIWDKGYDALPQTLKDYISIQGSEHCSYKSSRKHLKQFITDGPDVVLGAKEDAGVVAVATDNSGIRWCVVMSHESHNHPSQIVPYEGAATGVGGNVRDVMCMGAEVIACTDSFRFGNIKKQKITEKRPNK